MTSSGTTWRRGGTRLTPVGSPHCGITSLWDGKIGRGGTSSFYSVRTRMPYHSLITHLLNQYYPIKSNFPTPQSQDLSPECITKHHDETSKIIALFINFNQLMQIAPKNEGKTHYDTITTTKRLCM